MQSNVPTSLSSQKINWEQPSCHTLSTSRFWVHKRYRAVQMGVRKSSRLINAMAISFACALSRHIIERTIKGHTAKNTHALQAAVHSQKGGRYASGVVTKSCPHMLRRAFWDLNNNASHHRHFPPQQLSMSTTMDVSGKMQASSRAQGTQMELRS